MNSSYSMNQRPMNYPPNNNQRGVFPFLVGGVLGYGLGATSRPNYYPVPGPVFIGPPPVIYPPVMVYPPIYRRRPR